MTRFVNKRKDLNDEERLHLFMLLFKDFDGKKLIHGSITKNAELFGVSCKTVSRIWELGLKFIDDGEVVDLAKKLRKRVGQKQIHLDIEKLKEIPLRRRKTIVSLAHALGMSKSTVHRRIKDGVIRRHSSAIKPQLTDENKKARLRFCISMLQVQSSIDGGTKVKFMEIFDHVIIDEKWFYMSKETEKYYSSSNIVGSIR
ncbi:hypothetical protein LIER_00224 [Lithospermum erythrorhizon]|uniref:Transposase Tc1-like domain-containing protein n=1 Tax=Lithospermum erythrorhizon TaxID=34254 RepID=A0AAV3NK74_LITER